MRIIRVMRVFGYGCLHGSLCQLLDEGAQRSARIRLPVISVSELAKELLPVSLGRFPFVSLFVI